jgi:gliding motility-associated-like protein
MILKRIGVLCLFLMCYLTLTKSYGQCGGILEPGFAFLTSSRGCAPFTVNIQTLYLSSVPGTQYFINWGDGSPEEIYTQVGPSGVSITHTYPNNPVDCGYDLVIDASNACNPRGSVVPINTQVIVWTNDVVAIDPGVFRVCQGFAANMQFTDNSTWNCFPRATRENNEPRWIQWIYGTGAPAIQIPGIQINGITPGIFPYFNPSPGQNPIYPVIAPGQQSLSINIPPTMPADIGKEFEVTLKNWNQCNPYDNNLIDGNPFNPVSGNLVTGDNTPQVATARVVIVPSPVPDFISRLGGATGPIQSVFCLGDNIYFDNETPSISGANFGYTWQFFDNSTGSGTPLATSTGSNPLFAFPSVGQKLIRLSVRDNNAVGGCVAAVEKVITISPALLANINVTDINDVSITPDFCQRANAPFTTFQVKFSDASLGTPNADTQWRWEFYNELNVMTRSEPASGFSTVALGPFVESYTNRGVYRVKLIIRDNITGCQTVDEIQVRVFDKPVPFFTATRGCEGTLISFSENSTLQPLLGETIATLEWDFNYNGSVFNKDPLFDNQKNFSRSFSAPGTFQVALRATADISGCADILVVPVTVDPLPNAQFTPDVTSGCSELTVTFTNNSVASQPDVMDRYIWEIDERLGLGFETVLTQLVTDPAFSNQFIHTFENVTQSNQFFDVRMRAISARGCQTISIPVTITVFPGTRSGFISTNYSPFNTNCSPQTVNFAVDSETASLNPSEYRWQISDAAGQIEEISTGTTPSFNYSFSNSSQALKDFSVTLITTLSSGCFGDSTRTIRISPVPISLFLIDTLQFDCNVMHLQVEAVQKGLQQYHWEVQENGVTTTDITQTSDKFQYLISRPPSSSANINLAFSLDTKNFANCSSVITTQSISVLMNEDINASFTVSPVSQTLPSSTVTITNLSNVGPWTYLWNFGDGTQSTNPLIGTHSYSTFGKFNIRLTVTSGVCTAEQVQQVEVLPIPPIVDFEADPLHGCVPLTVNFTNLSQFADPSTYQWDFGDLGKSGSINPTHTYYEPGTYTVSLSASNITGQLVTETKQAIIEVYPRPVSAFEIKPTVVYVPGGILYTNNRSFDASRYEWDFGDGNASTAFEPEHKYKEEGTYTITLTAYNQFNCPDSTQLINAVKVIKGGQVLIPNAFSPGSPSGGASGDGKNDVFLPVTRGVTEFELMVFNRWGTLLFQSDDPTIGWDGTYQGKLCQQDVYVYKLTASYDNGERVVRMGDINLIR